ncbi:MAG: GntR family transcriptional regulator [Candidatus Fermentibacteraceae bacterium]|nr:GntR family transcriptional regulator [Candidatus Fermentibacteraceae bacterium]MBN2608106.1 GntR family transcriptional regulator [Candidatus Fermentibacteraceae bacterium]
MYHIDQRSPVPVYEQLARQIERHIVSGDLADGQKLPSIRELASTLRINPNTVVKTYRQLENEGLVSSRKGLGIFVSILGMDLEGSRDSLFAELTDEYVRKAAGLGMEGDQIVQGLTRRLKGEN